ncbi:MAG TPA: hypothetical protein VE777_06570 [Gaiellales bacterium]|nr:hypothetical protein [Gaiellales bacterium]
MEAPRTPADSPLGLADINASAFYSDLSTPTVAVGDPAVPFRLPMLGPAGSQVDLGRHLGKRPVALVFGSYT